MRARKQQKSKQISRWLTRDQLRDWVAREECIALLPRSYAVCSSYLIQRLSVL